GATFFFQAEDGIRDWSVTGVQTCALPIFINRLALATLPPGVTPQISPASPTGEILRYTLRSPKDPLGRPYYTLADLKALQDYTLQRELLRVQRIAGVTGAGGTIKRYEIHPDPDRLRWYGITLAQLANAAGGRHAQGSGRQPNPGPNQPGGPAPWPVR